MRNEEREAIHINISFKKLNCDWKSLWGQDFFFQGGVTRTCLYVDEKKPLDWES